MTKETNPALSHGVNFYLNNFSKPTPNPLQINVPVSSIMAARNKYYDKDKLLVKPDNKQVTLKQKIKDICLKALQIIATGFAFMLGMGIFFAATVGLMELASLVLVSISSFIPVVLLVLGLIGLVSVFAIIAIGLRELSVFAYKRITASE